MNQSSVPDGAGQGMPGMPGSVPPPPPAGGMGGEDPHEKIMVSLTRIEEKLEAIALKLGA